MNCFILANLSAGTSWVWLIVLKLVFWNLNVNKPSLTTVVPPNVVYTSVPVVFLITPIALLEAYDVSQIEIFKITEIESGERSDVYKVENLYIVDFINNGHSLLNKVGNPNYNRKI